MALRPLNPRSQRNIRFPRRRNRLVPLLLWIGAFCLTVWGFYSVISFFAGSEAPDTNRAENGSADFVGITQAETQRPQADSVQTNVQTLQDIPQNNAEVVALAARQYRVQNSTLPPNSIPVTVPGAIPETVQGASASLMTLDIEPGSQAPQAPGSSHSQATMMAQPSSQTNMASIPNNMPDVSNRQDSTMTAGRKLHNGVSWNIPYVGFKLDEIAASIQQKHPDIRPGKLEFQPTGVTTVIPNVPKLTERSNKSIALTINGCGPFGGGDGLFSLLKTERIPTTFFLSSTWIVKHKKDFTTIEKEPLFSIQGHGKKHIPLSLKGESVSGIKGTNSLSGIVHEIEGNARDIQRLTNKRPQWFRGAFNMYDKGVMNIISRGLNLPLAGYSLDANASSAGEITAKLLEAKHGDIIMLQFTNGKQLTEALAQAIPQLKSQGFVFIALPPPARKQ